MGLGDRECGFPHPTPPTTRTLVTPDVPAGGRPIDQISQEPLPRPRVSQKLLAVISDTREATRARVAMIRINGWSYEGAL